MEVGRRLEKLRKDAAAGNDASVGEETYRREVERKRVPGKVLYEADRLECLFFAGYDPHFEGDEPPGL